MPIQKQEFYEGAALHLLARTAKITALKYEPPLFHLNNAFSALLKYSTRGRSPWGFTFAPDEQICIQMHSSNPKNVIGLICGSDGIATLNFGLFLAIALPRQAAIRISCRRDFGSYYEVSGPDGDLKQKIAPSSWQRIFDH